MDLDSFCRELAAQLETLPTDGRVPAASARIAGYFGVRDHEVGFFEIDPGSRLAILRTPYSIGGPLTIPIHMAAGSLLAQTIRERRGLADNDFFARPHLHMVERTLAEPAQRIPVQKIMSAPVLAADEVRWVIQVSRKGANRAEAGADFGERQLHDLERIAAELAGRI